MVTIELGTFPGINFSMLDQELRAALPGVVTGTSYAKGKVFVHLNDELNAESYRPTLLAVANAHDPLVLTPEQAARARAIAFRNDVKNTSYKALLNELQSADTMGKVKLVLAKVIVAQHRLTTALELSQEDDPQV
jgi:hypothetical protein